MGKSYRVPCNPVASGEKVVNEDMCIIESMPVKSLITTPKSGIEHALGEKLHLRGHAWAGDNAVSKMHVSIDFGATWQKVKLSSPANRLAWQLGQDLGYPPIAWTNPFVPACVLYVEMGDPAEPDRYARSVDFETGEAIVAWEQGGEGEVDQQI